MHWLERYGCIKVPWEEYMHGIDIKQHVGVQVIRGGKKVESKLDLKQEIKNESRTADGSKSGSINKPTKT